MAIEEREVLDSQSSAGSINLSDSFQTILEKRRRGQVQVAVTPVSSKKNILDKTWTPLTGRLDETELEKSDWEPSDETFARMEQMCDNTQETAELERLLDEVNTPEKGKILKPIWNMTQITDIEAPSIMWDQTILHANSPKPSPIKMVGLLRPSTIIEESTMANSTESASNISEQEANRSSDSAISTTEESVISINSTGESFITAKADVTEMAYCTAADTSNASSMKSLEGDKVVPKRGYRFFHDSPSASKASVEMKSERSENFLDSLDVVEIANDSNQAENISGEDDSKQFNDTFELMDYMLNQAKKIENNPIEQKPEPMKPSNMNIKKPITPHFKKPQISRVPQPTSATKSKFNHIVSPIHHYIRNTPQNPTITRHHSVRDPRLFDNIDSRRDTQYLGQSKTNIARGVDKLPQVATLSASSQKMYDARTPNKMPGGQKINRLIGKTTPTVVKHEGRLKMHEKGAKLNAANNTVDQSFADLSLMSGDVSVRVVKNVNRV